MLRSLCVVRLGLIGPHSQTAAANVTDWIQLFLKASIAVQAIPNMSAESNIESEYTSTPPTPPNSRDIHEILLVVAVLPVDATAHALTALAADGAVGKGGLDVVHLDARAGRVQPCPLLPLLSAAGGDSWPRLPYSEWHARVRCDVSIDFDCSSTDLGLFWASAHGGAAEKALAVLPAAAAIPAGQVFSLPRAGDLQRSGAVATMLAAASLRSDCYSDAAFHHRWAKRAAAGAAEGGGAAAATSPGPASDSD